MGAERVCRTPVPRRRPPSREGTTAISTDPSAAGSGTSDPAPAEALLTPSVPDASHPQRRSRSLRSRPRILGDFAIAVVGYLLYAEARSLHGESLHAADATRAATHGHAVYGLEQRLHVDWEHAVQALFLGHPTTLRLIGGFYGSAHFLVTFGVLMWLLLRRPQAYRYWRSVLAVATFLALVVFVLYPVMPPRLLPPGPGHTVDTMEVYGGLWSYNHGVLEHITDPFAAMPSLHLAWATWCAAAVWYALPARSWLVRVLVIGYPVAVYTVVIITGTHFMVDGLAGVVTLLLGVALVSLWYRRRSRAETPVALPVTGDDSRQQSTSLP
ncbi:MAG TPA: phosphatase PAP2 family protein [Micromonosporaceae bacterium]